MAISDFADAATEVPESVRRLAGPDPVRPVWVNGDGGITFEVGVDPSRRFVKWAPAGSGVGLAAEAERMRWAVAYARVLGKADRWADLAVATWSTEWNFGPGWELPYMEAYGIEPDPERTQFYRGLWDLDHPV